jgi:hypothetical protein
MTRIVTTHYDLNVLNVSSAGSRSLPLSWRR